jgi:hypothetical protein
LDGLNLLEVPMHFGQNYQPLKKKEEEQLSSTGHQTLQMVLVLHLLTFLRILLVVDQKTEVMVNVVRQMVI